MLAHNAVIKMVHSNVINNVIGYLHVCVMCHAITITVSSIAVAGIEHFYKRHEQCNLRSEKFQKNKKLVGCLLDLVKIKIIKNK